MNDNVSSAEALSRAFDAHEFNSIVDSLREHARTKAGQNAFTFLPNGDAEEMPISFQELDARARAVAANLRMHVEPGARALLLFHPGLDFVVGFLGCLYAGVVAVPTYLPSPGLAARRLMRLAGIAEDAQPAAILTTTALLDWTQSMTESVPELQDACWLAVDSVPDTDADNWDAPHLESSTVAFLQYTSGSTGQPKGVMVTHGNLTHNVEVLRRAAGVDETSVAVGWIPPYHDMGLISLIVLPVRIGIRSVLMPTVAFLQRPLRWLRAIAKYRGTLSAAPNFAFDLCVSKATEEDLASLDLSSMRAMGNGAEPIRAESVRRFCETFARCGFHAEAILPAYGLAEATLFITGGAIDAPTLLQAFHGQDLDRGIARPVPDGDPAARTLVCHGVTRDFEVVIVDPDTHVPCPRGRLGEIWVAGDSVARGYWQRPSLSQETFAARLQGGEGPFLRTGDLGFQTDDGLYIVGRIKDVIIAAGQNHYPQDIEWTAERAHPGVRVAGVVAFGVEFEGAEVLVVALESHRVRHDEDCKAIASAVRRVVMQDHQMAVHDVVVLPIGAVPRTSSGKVQRRAARQEYLSAAPPWDRRNLNRS